MKEVQDNHSRRDRDGANGTTRFVIASMALNVLLLGVLAVVLYLAKYHPGMFTNDFARQHGHSLAAGLLLLWLLFSAVVDGYFNPAKRRAMEPGKRRAHLAFLAIGVPLSIAAFLTPVLTGACFICLGAKVLIEGYYEFKGRGYRWDYRLENVLWGFAFILIGIAMYFF